MSLARQEGGCWCRQQLLPPSLTQADCVSLCACVCDCARSQREEANEGADCEGEAQRSAEWDSTKREERQPRETGAEKPVFLSLSPLQAEQMQMRVDGERANTRGCCSGGSGTDGTVLRHTQTHTQCLSRVAGFARQEKKTHTHAHVHPRRE